MNAPLNRDIALRIGLAARALPEISPADLIGILDRAIGLPLSSDKLARLSMKSLRSAGGERFAAFPDQARKAALEVLKTRAVDAEDEPETEVYREGDMPHSLRIACASTGGERLDGHFGTCPHFLVYQVSAEQNRLIACRKTEPGDRAEDKNAWRAELIADCQVVHVTGIGGPAVAKLVRANIHPVKHPQPKDARAVMSDMQAVIAGAPPPWLARALGQEALTLKSFVEDATA